MFSSHAPLLMLSEPSSSSPPNKISKSVSGISLSERNYNQSAHDSLEPMSVVNFYSSTHAHILLL